MGKKKEEKKRRLDHDHNWDHVCSEWCPKWVPDNRPDNGWGADELPDDDDINVEGPQPGPELAITKSVLRVTLTEEEIQSALEVCAGQDIDPESHPEHQAIIAKARAIEARVVEVQAQEGDYPLISLRLVLG